MILEMIKRPGGILCPASDMELEKLDKFLSGGQYSVEIKDGKKTKSKQKLSTGEEKFKNEWQGEYKLVICIDDVLSIGQAQKRR